jgi:predicted enzyme related to lactoylglutathione lyase
MPYDDRYIPGVPCWVDTTQPDPAAALAFYGGLFGWTFEDVMPPGSPNPYVVGRLPGGDVAAVAGVPEGAAQAATWNTYIWVDSADDTAATVRQAGGTVLTEPFDVNDAGRMAVAADPHGAVFAVWEARQHRGAAVVNAPGSLNFNDLHTRDVAGAKAFYGAVFGWQTIEMAAGMAWTLPAYGDHLEAATPGLRASMAEMGAPDGFIDVVATLAPIAADDTSTPAHWGVTFAVDDADAVAAAATSLGGEVLSGPMDVPWCRMAVIRDPQGATFVASQFVPENKDLPG